MNTITVGRLRQNPTAMLADVETGESYTITRHNRAIARIVPSDRSVELIPPKSPTGTSLAELPRHELRTESSIDDLLVSDR